MPPHHVIATDVSAMTRRDRRSAGKNRSGMRYTKITLLIFGLGLVLGFVIVVGEFSEWERTAAAVMASGLVLLPVALFADGRGMVVLAWIAARFSRGRRKRARATPRPAARRKKSPAPATAPPRVRAPARGPRRKPSRSATPPSPT